MRLAGLAGALLVAAAPVSAQPAGHGAEREAPLGSRILREVEQPLTLSERETLLVFHEFARCLAQSRREQSLAVLDAGMGSPEERQALDRITSKESPCLRHASRLQMNTLLLRGALSEALYRRDFPAAPALQAVSADQAGEEIVRGHPLLGFARCVARADPAGVDGLLRTKPGSDPEAEVIRTIAPGFSSCLNRGNNLNLNRLALRSLLAEAKYEYVRGAGLQPSRRTAR